MKGAGLAAASFMLALTAAPVARGEAPRTVEVGLSLGVARPFGATQSGARVTDETFGAATVGVDVAYRVSRLVGVGVAGSYGAGIPTLCATASDCLSSLGSSIALRAFVRFSLPTFGSVRPYASAGLGWEWWTSRLADEGAEASRSYHGPLWLSGELALPFSLSRRLTLGPALGFGLGTFLATSLSTTAGMYEGSPQDAAVHGWVSLTARLAFVFGALDTRP